MPVNYATHVSPKSTPQSEPVPGKPTVPNSAGGHAFAVDDWKRLERFLVLGCEGGSYYAAERKLTQENAAAVVACVKADAARAVELIATVSDAGRAPKNDPAVFALALACAHTPDHLKGRAYAALPKVCRTGTHLFQFVAACDQLRGWGSGLRRAVADWYTSKDAESLGYQLAKYQSRDGWSHRDVLRLCHAKAGAEQQAALRWATTGSAHWDAERVVTRGKGDAAKTRTYAPPALDALPRSIRALESLRGTPDAADCAKRLREFGDKATREMVPTQFLTSPDVWAALLETMPLTAMLRNLATMTRVGLLAPLSDPVRTVCERLRDRERLKRARIHPLAVLVAMKTYASGKSVRGDGTWVPVQPVVEALNDAFYLAFDAVEPTNKRWLLALDVSGSMNSPEVAGMPGVTPRVGSAALALVTAATEREHHIVGFTGRGFRVNPAPVTQGAWAWNANSGSGVEPLAISPASRLDGVIASINALPMGPTDCALPMLYAAEKKIPVDVFAVFTDSETWHGAVHPFQALRQYREKTGIPAKLVVVGMVSSGFTIADPSDAGMLDCVGFDTAVPQVMADFARN